MAFMQDEHFVAFDDGEQTSLVLAQEQWREATQEVGSLPCTRGSHHAPDLICLGFPATCHRNSTMTLQGWTLL